MFNISLIAAAVVVIFSGCATNRDAQPHAPQGASQNSSSPTVSGYISVGAAKKF